jgi:hypothetical protein
MPQHQKPLAPSDLEKVASCLTEIAKARALPIESVERTWIARALVNAYAAGEPGVFDELVQALKAER